MSADCVKMMIIFVRVLREGRGFRDTSRKVNAAFLFTFSGYDWWLAVLITEEAKMILEQAFRTLSDRREETVP